MNTKHKCYTCKITKSINQFNKNKQRKSGHQGRCRQCVKVFRDANRTKINNQKLEHYTLHRNNISIERKRKHRTTKGISKYLFLSSQQRARKSNVPFSITKEWVHKLITTYSCCTVTKIPFEFGCNHSLPTSRTLDRVKPNLGYVPSNTILISHKANTVKNNGSMMELNALIKHLTKMQSFQGRAWLEKFNELNLTSQHIFYKKNGYKTNLTTSLFFDAKKRARKKKLKFLLSKQDIIIPTHCPVFNIPLVKGVKTIVDSSPTLDRIDNRIGYIETNIQVISYKTNRMKSDCDLQELQTIYNGFKRALKQS